MNPKNVRKRLIDIQCRHIPYSCKNTLETEKSPSQFDARQVVKEKREGEKQSRRWNREGLPISIANHSVGHLYMRQPPRKHELINIISKSP